MMMGSADALPQAPVEKTMFVEDMTDQQLAKAVCMGKKMTSVTILILYLGRKCRLGTNYLILT